MRSVHFFDNQTTLLSTVEFLCETCFADFSFLANAKYRDIFLIGTTYFIHIMYFSNVSFGMQYVVGVYDINHFLGATPVGIERIP